MELWIRSQDKTNLTKVSNLSLQEIKHPVRHDVEYYGIGTYYDNLQMLGKYTTKERALEVLDEIQNILQPRITTHEPVIDYDDITHSLSENVAIHCTQQIETELKQVEQVVYQMPEE